MRSPKYMKHAQPQARKLKKQTRDNGRRQEAREHLAQRLEEGDNCNVIIKTAGR